MACRRRTLDRLGPVKLFVFAAIFGLVFSACDPGFRGATGMELVDDSVVTHVFLCPGQLLEGFAAWEDKGDFSHLSGPPIWEVRAVEASAIERIVIGVEPVGFETVVTLDGPVPPDIIISVDMTGGHAIGGGTVADYPSDGNVLSVETGEVMTLDEWRAQEGEYCRQLDEQRPRIRLP